MKCNEFNANLEAFLSGEIDERTAGEMQSHAESCADCRQLWASTADLTNTLRTRGQCTMKESTESDIRSRVMERVDKRPRVRSLAGRRWALVGAAVVMLIMIGMSLMKQQSMTAAAAVITEAGSKLDSVTSYYVKYSNTFLGGMHKYETEVWYKSPDKSKMVMHTLLPPSEDGSSRNEMLQIVDGNSQWAYINGQDAVFFSRISDTRRQDIGKFFRTPRDILKDLGEGYKYVGTEKVGERDCDVIEHAIENTRVRVYIDRDNGFLIRQVSTENGKVVTEMNAVDISVNKPIPNEMFKPQITSKMFLFRIPSAPVMDGFTPFPTMNSDSSASVFADQLEEPDKAVDRLIRIGREGVNRGALLKKLYQPGYIPEGYKFSFANDIPEFFNTSRKKNDRIPAREYSTIYIEYINPDNGGVIVLTEGVNKPSASEGRNVSSKGFKGRIADHNELFPYTDLLWEADGVYFTLSSTLIDEQEAVKMARSMKLVFPNAETDMYLSTEMPSAGDEQEQSNESKSVYNLRQIGTAMMLCIRDNDGKFPSMDDPKQAKAVLGPYVSAGYEYFFTNPITGKPYLMNTTLSGQRLDQVKDPSQTVLFYEDAPADDGSRGVYCLDMRAGRVSEKTWAKLKGISNIP